MDWLPEAKRIPADRAGGTYSKDVPHRLVLHTTEGTSIAGAVAAYKKHGSWPHLTIDARKREVVQHYQFQIAARALKRPRGTVATNGASAIQVEIVGYAKDSPNWPAEDVVWLGQTLGPILEAFRIGRYSPNFVGPEAGTIATVTAPQRMSPADWLAFNGVAGHQHIPNNDHWDPGRFQIARFLMATAPPPEPEPEPEPPDEEDEVKRVIYHLGDDAWLANFDTGTTVKASGPSELTVWQAAGFPEHPKSDGSGPVKFHERFTPASTFAG